MTFVIEENSPPVILVFSGAGISAESGISTFRSGSDALWDGHSIEEVCTYDTWTKNYDKVHAFYNHIRRTCAEVEPNVFHKTIASWQETHRVINITQNVDNLLERAGCNEVLHVHGDIRKMVCTCCGETWEHKGDWNSYCRHCMVQGTVKPGVVFFGEAAPEYHTMFRLLRQLREGDVLVVAGTSGVVIDIHDHAGFTKSKNILSVMQKEDITEEMKDNYDVIVVGPLGETHGRISEAVMQRIGKGE